MTNEQGDFITTLAEKYDVTSATVEKLWNALRGTGGMSANFDIDELGGKGRWTRRSLQMSTTDTDLQHNVDLLCREMADIISNQTSVNPSNVKTVPIYMPGSFRPHTWWAKSWGQPDLHGQDGNVQYAYFKERDRLLIRYQDETRVFDASGYDIEDISHSRSSDWRGVLVHLPSGALVITALPEADD